MPAWCFLGIGALLLAGCADSSMQDAMSPLVGTKVNLVLSRWPAPTMSSDTFSGGSIYTWNFTTGAGGCTVNVITFPDNTIKTWSWNGTQNGPCATMAAQLRTGIGFLDEGSLR